MSGRTNPKFNSADRNAVSSDTFTYVFDPAATWFCSYNEIIRRDGLIYRARTQRRTTGSKDDVIVEFLGTN